MKVHIVFAKEDKVYQKELGKQLSGLVNRGMITSWDRSRILVGSDKEQKIRKKLNKCDVIVFLLSSDLMACKNIQGLELKIALERHKKKEIRIIPVLVRPCDWESTEFKPFQISPHNEIALTEWNNQDKGLLEIVEDIKKIVQASETKGKPTTLKEEITSKDNTELKSKKQKKLKEGNTYIQNNKGDIKNQFNKNKFNNPTFN